MRTKTSQGFAVSPETPLSWPGGQRSPLREPHRGWWATDPSKRHTRRLLPRGGICGLPRAKAAAPGAQPVTGHLHASTRQTWPGGQCPWPLANRMCWNRRKLGNCPALWPASPWTLLPGRTEPLPVGPLPAFAQIQPRPLWIRSGHGQAEQAVAPLAGSDLLQHKRGCIALPGIRALSAAAPPFLSATANSKQGGEQLGSSWESCGPLHPVAGGLHPAAPPAHAHLQLPRPSGTDGLNGDHRGSSQGTPHRAAELRFQSACTVPKCRW
ncbi:uncharacterized protein LOC116476311 [Hylobates moloch]|uniref:uncharacterized protein LOC116476311 n=1 Tax=Hylobates moloch TaxID=81572 RepID=UPI0013627A69|nr:uncharacterized protein LOC116476311 [Hylobates moloch]